MRSICFLCVVISVASLIGCSGATVMNIGATRGIDALESDLQTNGQPAPSATQYEGTRHAFLDRMREVLREQEQETGSSTRKIKNGIAGAGAILGLGGTIASLVIDDEDTKANVSQASGGIAGVSGVLGLLPIGSVPKGAEAIQTYLTVQIPVFEMRWPSTLDEPIDPTKCQRFVEDARQMERVVEAHAR